MAKGMPRGKFLFGLSAWHNRHKEETIRDAGDCVILTCATEFVRSYKILPRGRGQYSGFIPWRDWKHSWSNPHASLRSLGWVSFNHA